MPSPKPVLDEFDRKVLADRGISLEAARRNRLRTVGDELHIRFADLSGQLNCYFVRRPHAPPVRDGKPIKYIAPAGEPSRAFFPAEARAAIADPAADLFVTEGPLKSIAASDRGLPTVGLLGVWNWKRKDAEELIPDLAAVPWAGRRVYVVYDHDPKPKTRQNVDLARRRLARALRKAGAAEVYDVQLPPGPDGTKIGVDDFLVANGPDAFRELVEAAAPVPDPAVFAPLTRAEGRTDVANAARLVAKNRDDVRWVGPWDKWLRWDGARWRVDQLRAVELLAKGVAADVFAEVAAALKGGGT